MRRFLVLALAIAAVAAGGAHADGVLTGPGLDTGWQGVEARNGQVRYVALPGARETIVSAIRVRDGRVIRWGALEGLFGLPLVALDGSKGGLSRDGRALVLGSFDLSRFAVVSTRDLSLRRMVVLPGTWSFDAVSPDASTLYLVEYLGTGPAARYRVRVYDLRAGRLLQGAIVDRLEKEAIMRGRPVTRATSTDGRWAYTLYARPKAESFVHALDTVRREAFCVDLPLELLLRRQLTLRLKLSDGSLAVLRGRETLARINTATFAVRRS